MLTKHINRTNCRRGYGKSFVIEIKTESQGQCNVMYLKNREVFLSGKDEPAKS